MLDHRGLLTSGDPPYLGDTSLGIEGRGAWYPSIMVLHLATRLQGQLHIETVAGAVWGGGRLLLIPSYSGRALDELNHHKEWRGYLSGSFRWD